MHRVRLSRSQRNLYNGVRQDNNPALYLIGKSYRFRRLELARFLAALHATVLDNPVQLCVLENSGQTIRIWCRGYGSATSCGWGQPMSTCRAHGVRASWASHWCGIRCTPTRTGM